MTSATLIASRHKTTRVFRSSKTKSHTGKPAEHLAENDIHSLLREEQSWLSFNERVLSEAENSQTPLLERFKFLSIFYSNLDEFFMVKVSSVQGESQTLAEREGASNALPIQMLKTRVRALIERAEVLFEKSLVCGLAQNIATLSRPEELNKQLRRTLRSAFASRELGLLTPLIVDRSHPFPYFENQKSYLVIQFKPSASTSRTNSFGLVELPSAAQRLMRIESRGKSHYVFLEDVILDNLDLVFPWAKVSRSVLIRVTRNRELNLLDDDFDDLLLSVEQGLKDRTTRHAVRLESSKRLPHAVKQLLMRQVKVEEHAIYESSGRLLTSDLMQIAQHGNCERERDPVFKPQSYRRLKKVENPFSVIQQQDIWLHHPYESFSDVVHFLESAAQDPDVVSIKQTLYRTGNNSPVVSALIRAAELGKQVVAIVELTARFDEHRNIDWARRLKDAGATVVFGIEGWKTHAKMSLVIRHEGEELRRYAHLSTGNYNARTARIYTDLSLLTANSEITNDVGVLFNLLTGLPRLMMSQSELNSLARPRLSLLQAAPFGLRKFFKKMIEREKRIAEKGAQPHIILKLNSLTDPELIDSLYQASQSGVKIDLIVRGMCRLRSGITGLSENIRVVSIIDRFLEHSRIYYFSAQGRREVFVGSADFMPRNMDRRVECVWPVLDQEGKKKLLEILRLQLADNVKAHELLADGSYRRIAPCGNEQVRSQSKFIALHSGKVQT
jgi:polyphosphate kinase